MYPSLKTYLPLAAKHAASLRQDRKERLHKLAVEIAVDLNHDQESQLIFVCTHNSRRSHLAHIWAKIMSSHFQLNTIHSFSGGTETTAMHHNTVATLQRAGCRIRLQSHSVEYNPVYLVSYAEDVDAIPCFSKTYDSPPNPRQNFRAIMTCSDADENCPIVVGAVARHSLPYEDPKITDKTDLERQTYDERCLQIASEMWYLMSEIHKLLLP